MTSSNTPNEISPTISPTISSSSVDPKVLPSNVDVPFGAVDRLLQQLASMPSPVTATLPSEIAEYIERLAGVYSNCHLTAVQLGGNEAVALEIFQRTIEYFKL